MSHLVQTNVVNQILLHTDNHLYFFSRDSIQYLYYYIAQLKPGHWCFRDWSLITGRGRYKTGGGGQVKFYPYDSFTLSSRGGGGGRKKFRTCNFPIL